MLKESLLLKFLLLYGMGVCFLSPSGLSLSGLTMSFLFWVLLLGIVNLVLFAPMVGKLIFRKMSFLHRAVTSDIPGNPHAFDDCIISLMRTLPEPSNFNIVFTGMNYDKTLYVEGKLPPATINSITVYSRSSEPPVTLDLSTLNLVAHQRFKVVLCRAEHAKFYKSLKSVGNAGLLTYPDHWEGGFIAMRNFSVQNGCRVTTPTVSLEDGTVVRPPKALVAGVTAVKGVGIEKIIRVVVFNTCCFVRWTNEDWPLVDRQIMIGGLIAGYIFYIFLFFLGKLGMRKHGTKICPHLHEFRCPDVGEASKISQPSKEHRYWMMRYDMNSLSGCDLVVKVPMKVDGQKYWSLSVYDEYGLLIPQYVNIHNAPCIPNEKGEYEINIRLTLTPKENGSETGVIDMNDATRGYVIFRIVHPMLPNTETYSVPVASLAKVD